jgi:hypothetical protein
MGQRRTRAALHPAPATMPRFFLPAACLAGAVALGLCAGRQAQLISDAPSARAAEAAAAALPLVFFAGSSAALVAVGAAAATDRLS